MKVRLPLLLLFLALVAGCAGSPPGSSSATASPEACPQALLEGDLLADDASGLVVLPETGFVIEVVWPDGYVVRDASEREVLDPAGEVVAREGDHVSLGGGMNATGTAFVVCGPISVVPG